MGLKEDIREPYISQMLFKKPDEMGVMAFVWFCSGQRLELRKVEAATAMLPVDRGCFDGLTETDVHVAIQILSVVVNVWAEEGPCDCVELKTIQLRSINF